ncbi:t-SNARE protein [Pochonia chlamydosporia 170]|uniref:t-SNARE protein n=1 Tax=Pochonia chlamydosporia 170 TaxID=1380566 RepID=A0A179FNQ7_METCM|nr:t-SNARE protein [Pochonia chlamydosporia 170]OAQ66771.1 t-SNARE protein [Pochonia chlamydosporia 170]
MSSLPQGGRGGGDPVLNEVSNIQGEINRLNAQIDELKSSGAQSLARGESADLQRKSAEVMTMYRTLVQRFGKLKSQTSATNRNVVQVNRVEKELKAALARYNTFKSDYSKAVGAEARRQFEVVRPDASEREIAQVVEEAQSGQQMQIFQQALQQSGRQRAAQDVLRNVQARHDDLLKLERDLQEVMELMETMADMVYKQDEVVMKIEEQTEAVNDNLDKGVEEIGVAVNTARKTRKKKWICLGICGKQQFISDPYLSQSMRIDDFTVAIIIVVIIIVLIYIFVIRGTSGGGNKNNSKRAIEDLTGAVASRFMSVAAPHAKRLEPRAAIDEELAQQMLRISRERIHFPQLPNN